MPKVIEFTDEELADPVLAFRRLATVVEAMPSEVARAVPDYRDELKHIKTAVQSLAGRPALQIAAGTLEAAAQNGAHRGTSEAVDALKEALAAYRHAQRQEVAMVQKVERVEWRWKAAAAVALVLAGGIGGVALGVAAFPKELMGTPAGCALAGGDYVPAKSENHVPFCAFRGAAP